MKHYLLRYALHGPSDDTGGMYMAEIPVLPGCQAWGDTPEETIDILTSVAEEFIASYREHGEELPEGVAASELEEDVMASGNGRGDELEGDAADSISEAESILVAA